MKKGYKNSIEQSTLANNNFRQVLYTAKYCQLVLMSLLPGEEIGSEVHEDGDQFFRLNFIQFMPRLITKTVWFGQPRLKRRQMVQNLKA